MTKQFWVNNYFIDVDRNQIQHQQQATPIPPKALKVLEVLASRVGEVVSHDELMDIVWENSVVGPNTLQRAIAQLRKAFGDDSKKQAFIKTHSKKGYSLEANVRWENNSTEEFPQHDVEQPKERKSLAVLAAIAAIVLFVFILWPTQLPLFNHLTPLTASDEQEFNASYSPDGKYLVFNSYIGKCESHLWAKDLSNNQEERLSTEPGHYSQLSWSSDGSQLAFVLQSDCSDKPQQPRQCWQLQTLDFAQAWNGHAQNQLRYDCAGIKTTHPTWLNDGRIALLQYPQPDSNQPELLQPELVIYDAVADSLSKVPHESTGRIYSLDYSRQSNLLATVTLENDNRHVLRTLTLTGEIQSETTITPLENHSVYAQFPIKFSPDGTHFLTNVEGKIYRLSFDGDMTLIHPPSHTGLWAPSYHPDQTKVAVTLGTKDFDIGYLNTENEQADVDIFARSTAADFNAKFQPNGDLIAFISLRSGQSQIWIVDGDKIFQLTKFEHGMKSSDYDWAPDGQSLAVNVNSQLAIVNLDGSYRIIESTISVSALMPWTNPSKLLVTDNQADAHQLHSIDIDTGEITDLNIKNVLWSAFNEDNQIIYVDRQANFWLHSTEGTQPLATLDNKFLDYYLLIKDGLLYGIDPQAQLWRYNIKNEELQTVTPLNEDIIYISDIKDEQMLATKFMGGRRELVEFSQR